MKQSWIVLSAVVIGISAALVLGPKGLLGGEEPKKSPQDTAAKLDEIMTAMQAAKKAADSGDAKKASEQIDKAHAALMQLKNSIQQNEGSLVSVDNKKCPIMGMEIQRVPESLTRVYKGQKIGFCCHDCPQMWDRLSDEEKDRKLKDAGVAEVKSISVANRNCPIMGMNLKDVPEKNTREFKGQKIGFCCGDCVTAWDKLSDDEKAKKLSEAGVNAARPVKVDNVRCPIMGMAVSETLPSNTRQYKGKTIGFCCSDCPLAWDKLSDDEKAKKFEASMKQ